MSKRYLVSMRDVWQNDKLVRKHNSLPLGSERSELDFQIDLNLRYMEVCLEFHPDLVSPAVYRHLDMVPGASDR